MEKKTKLYILNVLLISMLVLNLFIFTSRMPFLPWFIEDAWGYTGVLITCPILIVIYFLLLRLQKGYPVNVLNKNIPIIVAMISLIVVFMYTSDLLNIVALIVNVVMLLITAWFIFIKK